MLGISLIMFHLCSEYLEFTCVWNIWILLVLDIFQIFGWLPSLQISAFYFSNFEKADCTKFAVMVGWSLGWSVSPLIFLLFYNKLEQK